MWFACWHRSSSLRVHTVTLNPLGFRLSMNKSVVTAGVLPLAPPPFQIACPKRMSNGPKEPPPPTEPPGRIGPRVANCKEWIVPALSSVETPLSVYGVLVRPTPDKCGCQCWLAAGEGHIHTLPFPSAYPPTCSTSDAPIQISLRCVNKRSETERRRVPMSSSSLSRSA